MSIAPGAASNSNSSKTFLTALVVNAGLLSVEVAAFLVLRTKLWRIYTPRPYLPPKDKRAQELPKGLWKWLPALLVSPPEDIIHKNGLDAYMFLRFLKMLIWIFLVFTILTFAIIIPAVTIHVDNTTTGLERISWSNIVDPKDQDRFIAHVIVVYILTFFVLYMIKREMLHFLHMRHQFLISESHSKLPQARTVLITSVPEELANEHDLRTFASFVPGGVDKVWLFRDTKKLNKLFEERKDACEKLEAAEAKLLRQATKAWRLKEQLHRKAYKKKTKDEENPDSDTKELIAPPATHQLLEELVPLSDRPKHRTGFWGLFGTKVDTIDWCKDEIARLNLGITEGREHIPLKMYDKWMEVNPKDVVWKNLDDGALEIRSRFVISWLVNIGLIIVWGFPAVFIGTLSNLDDLCTKFRQVSKIFHSPAPIPSIIQGVLPPALLAILFALLPLILRGLAWYECIPRYSLISVSVYRRFFVFLMIHGFLIVTLSAGITKVTQGLAGAGGALAQVVPLLIYFIRKWFLGRTPRQAYAVTFLMPSVDFGVIMPRLSLLATITFAYSVLSPLINFLALISYILFYIVWKYLLTQAVDQPDESETGGMYFPMAISNLFVGLYLEQVCLAALFFLKSKTTRTSSLIEAGFMIALIVITAVVQLFFIRSFKPVTAFLPMSLATKDMAKRYEKHNNPADTETDEDMDLFSRARTSLLPLHWLTLTAMKAYAERLKRRPGSWTSLAHSSLARGARRILTRRSSTRSLHDEEHPGLQRRGSRASGVSHASVATVASNASKASKAPRSLSHISSTPTIDPPAPSAGTDDEEGVEDYDDHAFDHPSTYKPQAWVWIPRDRLGFSELLAGDLRAVGVAASDAGAVMDKKGVVEVTRGPPGVSWNGGHDI
ncbi:late exocytosis, associated with Golgi transport-domain-containing protein [Infundibulicybe gibba]|nr:late exocytosis, associated with Golgi transport-domain-containing protein [Infundibulicybe gibba]